MTFPCVFKFLTKKTSTFDDFSLCFQVSDKKHKEKTSKVDVFSLSFGLNFEDEGAKMQLQIGFGLILYQVHSRNNKRTNSISTLGFVSALPCFRFCACSHVSASTSFLLMASILGKKNLLTSYTTIPEKSSNKRYVLQILKRILDFEISRFKAFSALL